jgi:hypothetical protein
MIVLIIIEICLLLSLPKHDASPSELIGIGCFEPLIATGYSPNLLFDGKIVFGLQFFDITISNFLISLLLNFFMQQLL